MSMPRDFPAYSIGRVGLTESLPDGTHRPVQENSLEFAGLAFAANQGLIILNKPNGFRTLRALGESVVRNWARSPVPFIFQGDPRQMGAYVAIFLRDVAADFPRSLFWNGDLNQLRPKGLGALYFNRNMVLSMAAAAAQGGGSSPQAKKMSARHRSHLFMFSLAMAHELTHLFVAYLAQGNLEDAAYTPPEVSFANYGSVPGDAGEVRGESGRWLESQLWGGAIEFYRDIEDDDGQTGIPFIHYESGQSRRIHSASIINLLTRLEDPGDVSLQTTGQPMTYQQRRAVGLLNLSSTQTVGPPQGRPMMGRQEGPLFSISRGELVRVAHQPNYIPRATRVR
ncbi:hypothetical protein HYQ44_012505 [Verticillium longisporum]|nr:hypothetical protein HYQ44_012505 [Verticillium longisporum]